MEVLLKNTNTPKKSTEKNNFFLIDELPERGFFEPGGWFYYTI